MDFSDKKLGPFHIKWEIGRGGTAIVYRATDTRSAREVALKILPPPIATDQTFLKRFIKEGKNATRLRHENIVTTYEAGEIDGIYYIAMELIPSGTLAEMSSKRDQLLSIDENINILSQIAGALDFAHSQGVLHRDVKPSNILVDPDGRILLTDFGTAKQMVTEDTMLTATGQRIGTPSFMSPEQITGDYPVDYRSDVYSLGVIAYKLFTGRLPFTGSSQTELLHKIIYETPISPDVLNPELPPNMVYNLKRALAKNPAQRYESAGQFVASMVAGQMWTSELMSKLPSSSAPSSVRGQVVQQARHSWQKLKVSLRPALIIWVVLALCLAPLLSLQHLTLAQIQTQTTTKADYLSSTLMSYIDTPFTTTLWAAYGAPLVNHFSQNEQSDVTIPERLQTIWQSIPYYQDVSAWAQRTWRYWNRVKVSDLLGGFF